MEIVTINLIRGRTSPVFRIFADDKVVLCMLDTGANIPVWCAGIDLLREMYLNCYRLEKNGEVIAFNLKGFGGKGELAEVYCIPVFRLYNLEFLNLLVVINPIVQNYGCHLILSYTLFTKTDYSIINSREDSPILEIQTNSNVYYCSPRYWVQDTRYITDVYCFVQNDIIDNADLCVEAQEVKDLQLSESNRLQEKLDDLGRLSKDLKDSLSN